MKSSRFMLSGLAAMTLSFGLLESPAAVIALYPFDTIASGSSPSLDTDPNSTASSIFAGAGVSMVSSSTGNPTPSGAMQNANTTTEAFAISGNDYFEFTITPQSGYQMDLTSLSLQYQRNNLSAPTNLFIRSSVDSYGSNLFSDGSLPAGSFETGTLSLSSILSFQDLTSAVTFRIYAWGGSGATSLRFDNVTLSGTMSAVPEPSSCLMLVMGLAVLSRGLRRESRRVLPFLQPGHQ